MVTDRQVRMLKRLLQTEVSLLSAAAKAGMDEKTARKYRDLGKLPSEIEVPRTWRTRPDAFEDVWDGLVPFLTEGERERGRGAEPSSVQAGGGPGPDAAG